MDRSIIINFLLFFMKNLCDENLKISFHMFAKILAKFSSELIVLKVQYGFFFVDTKYRVLFHIKMTVTHWAKMGLDFPFWWTFQKCIFIILGYCRPYLTEESTLTFSKSNFYICEKWWGSWWILEILENFIFLFNTFLWICLNICTCLYLHVEIQFRPAKIHISLHFLTLTPVGHSGPTKVTL